MKRLKQALALSAAICSVGILLAVPSQTSTGPDVNHTAHGRITRDEIWRGEMHVTGDIEVMRGVTLTIEPGTRVLIAANSDAHNLVTNEVELRQGLKDAGDPDFPGEPWQDEGHHIYINVMGTLNAVGTPGQMITITSDSPHPTRYDWTGIEVANGTMSYVAMEYYMLFGPMNHVAVRDCTLRHVGACAVCLGQPGVNATIIERNHLWDAGHELIDTHKRCVAQIRGNHVGPNRPVVNPGGYELGGAGIIIDGGEPQIAGNTIEGCEIGVCFLPVPQANPIDVWISQLCRDNTFTNNRHAFGADRDWRACPAADAGAQQGESTPELWDRP
jgi:hypothetical protein